MKPLRLLLLISLGLTLWSPCRLSAPARMEPALSPAKGYRPIPQGRRPVRDAMWAKGPLARAAVRIQTLQREGLSGWSIGLGNGVVTDQGVLTCLHVVDGSSIVYVATPDGTMARADSWRRVGDAGDLALVAVSLGGRADSVPVADSLPTSLTEAECFGYWGAGHESGVPFRIQGWLMPGARLPEGVTRLGGSWLPAAFPIMPGMSGAGVYVGGRLVGLCSQAPADGHGLGHTYVTGVQGP